jgi:hypothetical protein
MEVYCGLDVDVDVSQSMDVNVNQSMDVSVNQSMDVNVYPWTSMDLHLP